jgi:hypothetical protein
MSKKSKKSSATSARLSRPTQAPTEIPGAETSGARTEQIKAYFKMEQSLRESSRLETDGATPRNFDERAADIRDMHDRFLALGGDALSVIQRAIRGGKDTRLAFEVVKALGLIPNRQVAYCAESQQSSAELDEERLVQEQMIKMVKVVIERASTYRQRCEELDREFEQVGLRADYQTAKIKLVDGTK